MHIEVFNQNPFLRMKELRIRIEILNIFSFLSCGYPAAAAIFAVIIHAIF